MRRALGVTSFVWAGLLLVFLLASTRFMLAVQTPAVAIVAGRGVLFAGSGRAIDVLWNAGILLYPDEQPWDSSDWFIENVDDLEPSLGWWRWHGSLAGLSAGMPIWVVILALAAIGWRCWRRGLQSGCC
jgi:hypothetical protein